MGTWTLGELAERKLWNPKTLFHQVCTCTGGLGSTHRKTSYSTLLKESYEKIELLKYPYKGP